jgi:hypothetical protein
MFAGTGPCFVAIPSGGDDAAAGFEIACGWQGVGGNEWHYNTTYGVIGLVIAVALLILMRHDPTQGLSFAVVIVSATGWVRRRRPDVKAAGGPNES